MIAYDVISTALKTIATKLSATLPQKSFSNQKDEIASTLNAISQADIGGGGGSSPLIVTINSLGYSVFQMNTTAGEIMAAFISGTPVICSWDNGSYKYGKVVEVSATKDDNLEPTDINVRILDGESVDSFYCESADGYPRVSFG